MAVTIEQSISREVLENEDENGEDNEEILRLKEQQAEKDRIEIKLNKRIKDLEKKLKAKQDVDLNEHFDQVLAEIRREE